MTPDSVSVMERTGRNRPTNPPRSRSSSVQTNPLLPQEVAVFLPTDASGREVLNILRNTLSAEQYSQIEDSISRPLSNTRVSEWLRYNICAATDSSSSILSSETSSIIGASQTESVPSSAGALAEQMATLTTREGHAGVHMNDEVLEGFMIPIEEGRSVDTQGRRIPVIRYPTDSRSDSDRCAVPSIPSLVVDPIEEETESSNNLESLPQEMHNRGTNQRTPTNSNEDLRGSTMEEDGADSQDIATAALRIIDFNNLWDMMMSSYNQL